MHLLIIQEILLRRYACPCVFSKFLRKDMSCLITILQPQNNMTKEGESLYKNYNKMLLQTMVDKEGKNRHLYRL